MTRTVDPPGPSSVRNENLTENVDVGGKLAGGRFCV